MEEELTLIEAADRAGVRPVTLRSAISKNKLVARKKGRDWFVKPSDLEIWRQTQQHVAGRPRKKAGG